MDKVLITILGLGLIGFIWWFFFGQKKLSTSVSDQIDIKVAGGYSPSNISVPAGRSVKVTLTRTEDNPCLEEIVVPDLKISRFLPLNQSVSLDLTFPRPGSYPFHCGMNMYHGQFNAV